MFLDGWKVCQILHIYNQVQRSEFTQPRVLLNAASVMDAGFAQDCIFLVNCLNYGQSREMDSRNRWLKPVSVGRHRSLLLI